MLLAPEALSQAPLILCFMDLCISRRSHALSPCWEGGSRASCFSLLIMPCKEPYAAAAALAVSWARLYLIQARDIEPELT